LTLCLRFTGRWPAADARLPASDAGPAADLRPVALNCLPSSSALTASLFLSTSCRQSLSVCAHPVDSLALSLSLHSGEARAFLLGKASDDEEFRETRCRTRTEPVHCARLCSSQGVDGRGRESSIASVDGAARRVRRRDGPSGPRERRTTRRSEAPDRRLSPVFRMAEERAKSHTERCHEVAGAPDEAAEVLRRALISPPSAPISLLRDGH